MAVPRNKDHILIKNLPVGKEYIPVGSGGGDGESTAPSDRKAHAVALRTALDLAYIAAEKSRTESSSRIRNAASGCYLQIESRPGGDLKLLSLENQPNDQKKGIRLASVRLVPSDDGSGARVQATVFVPNSRKSFFQKRLQDYANSVEAGRGKSEHAVRHSPLIDSIGGLQLAVLESLWTDHNFPFPLPDESLWWEIWLQPLPSGKSGLDNFLEFAALKGIEVNPRTFQYVDRTVVLAKAKADQLRDAVVVDGVLAELRRARVATGFQVRQPVHLQIETVKPILDALSVPDRDAPAICILDTGVNSDHSLLAPGLDAIDCHAVDANWGVGDNGGVGGAPGHGTNMAGLALYGDINEIIVDPRPLSLSHRLESVKILPPGQENDPENYGAITASGVYLPEIAAPSRQRIYAMAVTSAVTNKGRGQPTAWSITADALAAGRAIDVKGKKVTYLDDNSDSTPRLILVSMGNCVGNENGFFSPDHLAASCLTPAEDPAQAWNVVSVGAYTEKVLISNPTLKGYTALAKPGELSPYSATSVVWGNQHWPIKPEIVLEGGNAASPEGSGENGPVDDLLLLTTSRLYPRKLFETFGATSAATAQAARLAAVIQANNPGYWPETVRGLLIHSAEWTPQMVQAIDGCKGNKQKQELILRRYGYGVPTIEKALKSSNSNLTLIAQHRLEPFRAKPGKVGKGKFKNKSSSTGQMVMGDIHFFGLPWPNNALEVLGNASVRLRVTLSYFIVPRPGERGGQGRYQYRSHGLRFDVLSPTETPEQFRERKNRAEREDPDVGPGTSGVSDLWLIGAKTRDKGSIHSDLLETTAANLARMGEIAVYPVGGWWKDSPKHYRSRYGVRYSLIVSIETDEEGVDLWTPVNVANEASVTVEHTVPGTVVEI